MAAPLVAAATPAIAQPIVESAVKVLSTDIVKVKGTWYRKVRLKEPDRDLEGRLRFTKTGRVKTHTVTRYDPVEVQANVNPVGIGALLAGAGIGAALLFGRFKVGVLGIGELELYKGPFADSLDRFLNTREIKKTTNCSQLEAAYRTTSENCAAGSASACAAAQYYLARGKHLGCPWATG